MKRVSCSLAVFLESGVDELGISRENDVNLSMLPYRDATFDKFLGVMIAPHDI